MYWELGEDVATLAARETSTTAATKCGNRMSTTQSLATCVNYAEINNSVHFMHLQQNDKKNIVFTLQE